MRIAAARLLPYRLPLRRPWVAAATTLAERRGALLALTDADGVTGWGDCAPLPSGGNAAAVLAALYALAGRLAGDGCRAAEDAPPEVRWALETAQTDLAARHAGVPLWRHLGGADGQVAVNAALGPLDEGCAERAAAALASGYGVAKLKVGLEAVEVELGRLRRLAAVTGGRLRLRLDANRAWDEAAARRFLTAVADLAIDGVEEPLAAPTPAGLGRLQQALPFAIAVDESLPSLGIDAVLAAGVRRLVVKPARVGGIAATRVLAAKAAAAGVEVVLTSVVDSAVGVAAAAHLAAALPRAATIAHGLATGAWLAADVGPPLAIAGGRATLAAAPGLGFEPRVAPGEAADGAV